MFAFVSILLVAAVSSHKILVVFDGDSEAQKSFVPFDGESPFTLTRKSDQSPIFSLEVVEEGNNERIVVTSDSEIKCESKFLLQRVQAHEFDFDKFISTSTSPFLGTVKVGSGRDVSVAYIFVIPDGPDGNQFDDEVAKNAGTHDRTEFDEDVAENAALSFMDRYPSKVARHSFSPDFVRSAIDRGYTNLLEDFQSIPEESRRSLSNQDRQLLIEHLRKYSVARHRKVYGKIGITAITVNSDGSFSYVHGVGTEAAPLELLYEDSPLKCYVSVDGKSANFQNIPDGASFPTAMSKIENRQLMTKIGSTSFLGVAELSEGRTFFLLNAQPVDILTMLQVLKLKDKTLDEVYNFSVELFKLSASHKVNLENDFMSIPKHTRGFIDSVGEKERVLKKLQDERQARGNNDYNELGITAVPNGAIPQYGLETLSNSLLTITLSKMSNTADINADIGLISAGSTLQTAQRTLTKGTYKVMLTPATPLLGVLHHLGVKKPRKISRWYILVNAKAAVYS